MCRMRLRNKFGCHVAQQQAQSSQAELQQDGTGEGEAASDAGAQGTEQTPAFSDDMLRMISQEVVQENADMILSRGCECRSWCN